MSLSIWESDVTFVPEIFGFTSSKPSLDHRLHTLICQMESLRKRFMIARPLGSNPSVTNIKNENHGTQDAHTIIIVLSSTKRIVLSNGVVTLHDSFGATDVSTSSSPEAKILALESLQDLLQLEGRDNLDPTRESPVVNRIIETFPSKSECIETINRYVSTAERRRILTTWATDVWGDDQKIDPPKKSDSDRESPVGSLFSDSDVQEIPDNRVRPITLRPRKSIQPNPAPVVKIEGKILHQRAPESSSVKRSQLSPSSYSPRGVRRGSPSRNIRERSPRAYNKTSAVSEIRHRMSSPALRHKSEVNIDRTEVGKKRPVSKPENIAPDAHRVKRVKSAPDGFTRTDTTFEKSSTQKSQSEQPFLAKALNETTNPNDPSSVSSAEVVSKYWREITMKFPPEVKALPTIDRLAYYFREAELAKEENKIIKRDESERRKSMVLLAEKIRLMNQPVVRGK